MSGYLRCAGDDAPFDKLVVSFSDKPERKRRVTIRPGLSALKC